MDGECMIISFALSKNTGIQITKYHGEKFSDEENEILKRIANVFEQAYVRFLDLQKAEEQARQAQIEAALERVRARSMAMHKSEELAEVVDQIKEEIIGLGIEIYNAQITTDFTSDPNDGMNVWISAEGQRYLEKFHIPFIDHSLTTKFYDTLKNDLGSFTKRFSKSEKNAYFKLLFKHSDFKDIPEERKNFVLNSPGWVICWVILKNSMMEFARYNLEKFNREEIDVFKLFGKVFEQAYTRFLDLQKAEAQAREAQIEAALERIRSLALGMHKSEEVGKVTDCFFAEFNKLTVKIIGCSIVVVDEKIDSIEIWRARSDVAVRPFSKSSLTQSLKIIKEQTPESYSEFHKALGSKNGYSKEELSGEKRLRFLNSIAEQSGFSPQERSRFLEMMPAKTVVSFLFFKLGYLALISEKELTQENLSIARRFVDVFDFAYTRFLDLQKAEAQAREAEIQLALERVRARTMAMHKSEELAETAAILFQQMTELGVSPERINICLIKEADNILEVWATDQQGVKISHHFKASLDEPTTGKRVYDAWKDQKKSIVIDLSGKELNDWIRYVREEMGMTIKDELIKEHRIHSVAFFSQGMILTTTPEPLPDESIKLLERFADVFNLTYRRFLDLQKAEAQAREAIKQASLDRVRGEIASMRTTEDLNRITPVIWKELKTLNVPFIRCGVFIINEDRGTVQVYLSKPDGKSLAALNLPIESTSLTRESVALWREGAIYKEHWDRDDFVQWMQSLIDMGQVQNTRTYQGADQPPESLDLHFLPFTQGMLYVGNTSPLTEEEIELVQSLAETFSVAYARYEDFKNLEEAKNKIELTLSELKATQSQLVQAEKMASLGELTAGIAHEIQNPLNFVNNFSEVSTELLEEMKEEIENGDLEEVKAITEDVTQNLEKILHHGRRADGIVKGMLQHSRGSSGQKEPTDLNALADEYLRLSYHGLRARDKSFTADFKLEADESLPKLNVVPQDIGRVLLNLINNAFYAVSAKASDFAKASSDKSAKADGSYKPSVLVSTQVIKSPSGDSGVEIRVKDNGHGIPDEVKKKIFQPFFTTKPTGQGTGLGLSMSYDIIKAHGGEMKVETKEDNGTTFIIQIPA